MPLSLGVKTMRMYSIKEILRKLVVPALGCTEVVSIALASAYCSSLINRNSIDFIELWLSPDVFRNAFGVIIPKTKGLRGPQFASALGAFGGDPLLKMEVLSGITSKDIDRAVKLVEEGKVKVNVVDKRGLYVKVKVFDKENVSEALIEGYQDRVVYLKLNDKKVDSKALKESKDEKSSILKWIRKRTLQDLFTLLEDLDKEDLCYLKEGVLRNLKLAEFGLLQRSGMGIGFSLKSLTKERRDLLKEDPVLEAKILTASAADARMAGADLPATSSAGSGNNGLVATIPVWVIGKALKRDEDKILRAICLSHLITAKVKTYMGQLSYMCSCSIAAGAGFGGSLVYLLKGSIEQVEFSILNLIEDLTGVICDGAKPSCALKLITAVQSGYQSALFALKDICVSEKEGIISNTLEKSLENLELLNQKCSYVVDNTVLEILTKKLNL